MGHTLKKYNGIMYMKFGKMQRIEGYNILFSTNIWCIYFWRSIILTNRHLTGNFFGIPFSWHAMLAVKRQHWAQWCIHDGESLWVPSSISILDSTRMARQLRWYCFTIFGVDSPLSNDIYHAHFVWIEQFIVRAMYYLRLA